MILKYFKSRYILLSSIPFWISPSPFHFFFTKSVYADISTNFVLNSYKNINTDNSLKSTINIQDCHIIKNETRGKFQIVELEYEELFTHTPKNLMPYFKSKDMITTYTSLSKFGKQYYINLKITIFSKEAAKTYGNILIESNLKVLFVNKKEINLSCLEDGKILFNNQNNTITYEVYYQLNNSDFKNIHKQPIDKIGIMWTSGFELYTVYEVNLLMNQINCIKSL